MGMVSPGTSSTVQPYPCSRMILSTSAMSCAEAQFMLAIWTLPHSAIATPAPSSSASPRDAFFASDFMFVLSGFLPVVHVVSQPAARPYGHRFRR